MKALISVSDKRGVVDFARSLKEMGWEIIATGGTMNACYELVKSMNPKKIYINFIVELTDLHGRDNLPKDVEITSLLKY